MSGAVHVARGARHAEALVLEAIRRHAEAVRSEPALLARPLQVVVPSQSLRVQLAAAALRHVGGSLAGVVFRTLHGLAHEVLARSGEPLTLGEALLPVLTRRCASREPVLRQALEGLEDGYGAASASVSDLIDAGLEPALAGAIDEALSEAPASLARDRARALVRVAAGVLVELAELGLAPRAELFRRASARLAADPERALPGPVLVHGYADATGVQADLLRDLLVYRGAQVFLDHPPDPADPARTDLGARYAERLELRLAAVAPQAEESGFESAPPALLCASGAHGEARAAAERIRSLLDAGAVPESIAVVARNLESHLTPLRIHLRRLGIPYSGAPDARGPLGPDGRPLRALLDLLLRREQAASDRWLDARIDLAAEGRSELRLAFHTLGAPRLADLAALDLAERLGDATAFGLPVRTGLSESEDGPRRRRRTLPREALAASVDGAAGLLARFAGWTPRSPQRHARELEQLLAGLGWGRTEPARLVADALDALVTSLPEDLELEAEEFRLILERALGEAGRLPPGGAGAGVALLSATDARSLCFEHLFVVGMNRDRFPRVVSEDPLLPDAWRRRIETLLPDVPLKRRGHDEERYLFAQLVSSSPRVTLLHQSVDDDGKERNPSPFIERIRLALGEARVAAATPLLAAASTAPASAAEQAMRAGLRSGACPPTLLAEALAEGRGELGLEDPPPDLAALAAARLRVVAEFERGAGGDLGAFFGAVGPAANEAPVFVTFLEGLAFCPWKTFLSRSLGLEAVPDAGAELPALSKLLQGQVLHAVLERLAIEAGVPDHASLEQLAAAAPQRVPWPQPDVLRAWLDEEARRATRDAGIGLRGFARLLAAAVEPLVAAVGRLDWPAGERDDVLGVEVFGELPWPTPEGPRLLRFRADRVDADGSARRLTDYKGGRPLTTKVRPDSRERDLRLALCRGQRIQAMAYAKAGPPGSEGRYVQLVPGDDGLHAEELVLAAEDPAATRAFEGVLAVLGEATARGAYPPRLLSDDLRNTNPFCASCEMREACVQGDSGARRRLRHWLQTPPPQQESPFERARRGLARLPGASLEEDGP